MKGLGLNAASPQHVHEAERPMSGAADDADESNRQLEDEYQAMQAAIAAQRAAIEAAAKGGLLSTGSGEVANDDVSKDGISRGQSFKGAAAGDRPEGDYSAANEGGSPETLAAGEEGVRTGEAAASSGKEAGAAEEGAVSPGGAEDIGDGGVGGVAEPTEKERMLEKITSMAQEAAEAAVRSQNTASRAAMAAMAAEELGDPAHISALEHQQKAQEAARTADLELARARAEVSSAEGAIQGPWHDRKNAEDALKYEIGQAR